MMLTRYMFREVRRRPGRTVLTVTGVVIGVQSLVAIPLTIQSTRRAHRALFEGLTGRAALEVVPCGEGGFSPDLAARLEGMKDVRAAVPVIQSAAAIWGPSGLVPVMTLGFDIRRNDQARDFVLRRGSLLENDAQVLLEESFAQSLGFEVGTAVRLLTASGASELRVAGLLEPRGAVAVNAGAVAIIPLATSQQLYRLEDKVNSLNLVLTEGADPDQVALEVSKRLPPGLTVQVPAARAALAQETIAGAEKLLSTLSVASLVAGAFVIFNSFLMSIGERRRALAILRSLGATRRQVTRLLFLEAVALGVVGTAVGIPVGVAAAFVMTHLMAQMSGPFVPELQLTAGPFVLAGMLGPGVALLATYLPSRNAGRRSPLAELRERPGANAACDTGPRRRVAYLGLGLIAVVTLVYTVIVTGRLPGDVIVFLLPVGIVLALVGGAMAVPMALAPLLRLTERLLRPVLGIEASLAVRNRSRRFAKDVLTWNMPCRFLWPRFRRSVDISPVTVAFCE